MNTIKMAAETSRIILYFVNTCTYCSFVGLFLGASANYEKRLLALSCLSVRLSAHVEQLGSHLMDFDEM